METPNPWGIDPVLINFGLVQVRWYGLMYVIGFVVGGFLVKKLIKRGFFTVSADKIDSLVTHVLICMFIGARLFYVFIYNFDYYSQNLGEALAVWKGGLSFHGALTGIFFGAYLFAKKNKISWFQTTDVIALGGAQGLFWGRMGNFINGELWGRPTDSFLGMVFRDGGPYARHPSQLYEGVMEGILLPLILWFMLPRVKHYGYITAMFIIGYGVFRYIVEFFREPDAQLGYYFGGTTTMGQILCLIMILVGFITLWFVRKKKLTR